MAANRLAVESKGAFKEFNLEQSRVPVKMIEKVNVVLVSSHDHNKIKTKL